MAENKPTVEGKSTETTKTDTKEKRLSKNNRRSRKFGEKKERQDKFNDVSWYTKYKELYENAARLGFNHIGGRDYLSAFTGASLNASANTSLRPAVIARVKYIVTPGILNSATDGFNIQMRRLYLAMKRKYRGLNTYEIGDLGVTLFAIAEFYRYVAKLERIYGIMNFFSTINRTSPEVLLHAMRVDYDDLKLHLADFRYGINALIRRAASLCLPKGMDIVNRWFFLESNIFKDSEDPRAAYIFFDDQDLFYTYQSKMCSSGGSVQLCYGSKGSATYYTAQKLLEIANEMLDLLLEDDDITLILGDIVSYFTTQSGDTPNLLTLEPIPEDYVVTPVYNKDVLLQIHNCTPCGPVGNMGYNIPSITVDDSQFDGRNTWLLNKTGAMGTAYIGIMQVDGIPTFNLTLGFEPSPRGLYFDQSQHGASSLYWKAGNNLLDTWVDVPTPDDIMEMSRLVTNITVTEYINAGSAFHEFDVFACGTEIVNQIDILGPNFAVESDILTIVYAYFNNFMPVSGIMYATQIDWMPHIYNIASWNASTTLPIGSYALDMFQFGDLDNARVLPGEVLQKLHDSAVMSLFKIESVEAFNQPGDRKI